MPRAVSASPDPLSNLNSDAEDRLFFAHVEDKIFWSLQWNAMRRSILVVKLVILGPRQAPYRAQPLLLLQRQVG
jgi:hypothetical protein